MICCRGASPTSSSSQVTSASPVTLAVRLSQTSHSRRRILSGCETDARRQARPGHWLLNYILLCSNQARRLTRAQQLNNLPLCLWMYQPWSRTIAPARRCISMTRNPGPYTSAWGLSSRTVRWVRWAINQSSWPIAKCCLCAVQLTLPCFALFRPAPLPSARN